MQTEQTHITFVLTENMLATGTVLPMEMLRTAQLAYNSDKAAGDRQIELSTTAQANALLSAPAGLQWVPDTTLDSAGVPDIIYLPALWRNPRPTLQRSGELIDWLRACHENGSALCAVGTGCCFMAEAGLLDGQAATTHWHYFDQFQRDYPEVKLKRQHFITQSGRRYCAASVNSLADLTVHFISRLFNRSIAGHVERHFSHEIRRSYESSAYYENDDHPHPDEQMVQVQMWLRDNYARFSSMNELAKRFDMSTRTLNRRFKSATGLTPHTYLTNARMAVARDLLKTSNLSISEIAERCGYQDTAYFADLFKQHLDTNPRDYRATVRAKLFSSQ
ncbi:helix-turn-helix domain-containing protein [Gilvimarinus agarilyticus]|uniref:GlxA family transcriptional regulator n=1 Tax=unclassified Gilvimarinus TaxID=2642066 RepID=UPI001C08D7C2|nr:MULTISPECIES: helix-turn-helix domain-containing protein [unclassified Gilvimarinus]MBU2885990.1 helix-turn-helix domain-containing protein [Gilvimarinus agarilyticus]MDO6570736.1 helix-turn-helix domain-containing protein [Gilvimarinus sp. 2_MG-2023]MDO6747671.1 helix-turn-helix domain-containing protein [Gilvimarinus sp. 1_MG-2023]